MKYGDYLTLSNSFTIQKESSLTKIYGEINGGWYLLNNGYSFKYYIHIYVDIHS